MKWLVVVAIIVAVLIQAFLWIGNVAILLNEREMTREETNALAVEQGRFNIYRFDCLYWTGTRLYQYYAVSSRGCPRFLQVAGVP